MRRHLIPWILLAASAASCARAPEPARAPSPARAPAAEVRPPAPEPTSDDAEVPAASGAAERAETPAGDEQAPSPGPSYLGSPTVTTADELPTQQWIQDGGQRETVTPAEGRRFVVLHFTEAPEKVSYTSTDFTLVVEGEPEPLPPYAVTSPSANPIQPRANDPGPLRFQREVWMFVDWEPGPNTPLAVAFEVPSSASSGVLRIKDAAEAVSW